MTNEYSGETVVFVDDEAEILEILEARFKKLIPGLRTFSDPNVALEFIQKADVDLLVTDLKMPTMDGLQLFERARKVRPLLVGIFLTGYGDKASIQRALQLGAFDFIDKPFNDKVLTVCVTRGLEKAIHEKQMREVLELFVKTNTQLDPEKFDALSPEKKTKTLAAALGVARMQIENLRKKK